MITVIRFHAEWCNPCKNFAPKVEMLKDDFDDLIFTDVDIDDNPQLRKDYHIMSIPTLILTNEGKEIARHIGSEITYSELREWVNEQRDIQRNLLPQ